MEPSSGTKHPNSGFTLIEILLALTVCSVGMLGLLALQVCSIRNISSGGAATMANALAQSHMEKIIHADFHSPGLNDINPSNNGELDSTQNIDYQNIGVDGSPVPADPFLLTINVADHFPIRHTKTVAVVVTWDSGKRMRKLYTIKSFHNQPHER